MLGLFKWQSVRHVAPQLPGKVEGQRLNAFGRVREIVEIRFAGYEMAIFSSHAAPPLGLVRLVAPALVTGAGNAVIEGPIEQKTWSRMGELIRSQQQTRKAANG